MPGTLLVVGLSGEPDMLRLLTSWSFQAVGLMSVGFNGVKQ